MSDDRAPLIATGSQTVGPFFHFGLAEDETLGRLAGPDVEGDHIHLRIRVLDGDGVPVPDALIELLQADEAGRWFGRLATDREGSCVFATVRPGAVPDGLGGLLAPHINVCLFARGLMRHLYTRIYFAGDAALDRDPLLVLVPADRRHTLLAQPARDSPPTWQFDIRLQGEQETVFFDL